MVRYEIDPSHTNVGFSAKHLAVSTVHGHFSKFDGFFEGPDDDFTQARGEVKIDVASLSTKTDQRDNNLRSADFFDAEKFPYMTYKVTGVQHLEGDTYKVTGDLTIKEVTRPVTLDLEYLGTIASPFGDQRAGFSATTEISHKDWGITFNMALEGGGVVVGDKVKLDIEAEAILQK